MGYAGGIAGIISADTNSTSSYYHYDGLGSVTNLTDASGQTNQTYTYDAFGNILRQSGTVDNNYNFQTKEASSLTGLVYFGARYYDPKIGRWLTPDPLGMIDGPNVYVYLNNNPVNLVDPWGMCELKVPWWFPPIQRAISAALGTFDKNYPMQIGGSQYYYEMRPFQFPRNIVQGIGVVFGTMRIMEPWMLGNFSSIDQAQAIVAVRGMKFMAVTAGAGWGAEIGVRLGALTGPLAPVAIPIFAAGGAAIGGGTVDWAMSHLENALLNYGGITNP